MRCLGSESTKSSEVKELFHGDFLVFGSACCFFVCLDDLAVSDSHRVRKLPAWWALGMKERTKVMQEILDSDATSKELQVGWPKNTLSGTQKSSGLESLEHPILFPKSWMDFGRRFLAPRWLYTTCQYCKARIWTAKACEIWTCSWALRNELQSWSRRHC